MSTEGAERSGPRTLQEAKQWMHDKLAKRVHPLGLTDPPVTAALIDQLKGLDGDSWAEVWGGRARGTARRRSRRSGPAWSMKRGDCISRPTAFTSSVGFPARTIRASSSATGWNARHI
jgi:hypothetical protein